MASAPNAQENEVVPSPPATPRPPRRPFHRDPLSLISWSIALAAIVAYWTFFVRKPAPKPGEQIARLTAVEGAVKVKPNATPAWTDARLADLLRVGDVVQTYTRSGAEISFNSGNRVTVRPDSVVYIGGSAESSTAAWRVQSGRVNFSVAQEQTEIVTPTVRTTALQNASGNIDVAETGETGVKIFRGQAEVETTQGQRIRLGENQAVQVDAAGKAGARLDLPPAPMLLSPAVRAHLERVPPPGASASLTWTAVVNGTTYHVAVDYNVMQANLLLSAALEETGIEGTSHTLSGLEVGRYFWRVAAVNPEGLEGAFSRTAFFSVVAPAATEPAAAPSPTPAGPLLVLQAVEEVAPGIVHVGGRTEPGGAVEVGGASVRVLPDGSFSEYVRHAGGKLTVRATGPGGAAAEQSRTPSRK
jgi:hypothetical protein